MELERLADLARLSLAGEDREGLNEELEQMIGYMSVLDGLDTDGVEPMHHVISLKNILREDFASPSTPRALLLQNAPVSDGVCWIVPRAVEGGAP